jgi:hypothetical protein
MSITESRYDNGYQINVTGLSYGDMVALRHFITAMLNKLHDTPKPLEEEQIWGDNEEEGTHTEKQG